MASSFGVVFLRQWRLRVHPRRRRRFLLLEVAASSSFGRVSGGGNHCSQCLLLPETADFSHFLLLL